MEHINEQSPINFPKTPENFNDDDKTDLYLPEELKPDIFYKIIMPDKSEKVIYPLQTGSYYSTLFFLIFSTLGSGIIILPITMMKLGIIWSSLMLASAAMINYFTLTQLVNEAYINKLYYFSDLVEKKYGKVILIMVEICFHVGNLLGVIVFNKVSNFLTKFFLSFLTFYRFQMMIQLLIFSGD